MKRSIALATIGCLLVGCISLTAQEPDLCVNNSLPVPNYSGVPNVPGLSATVSTSTTFDVSKTASKLNSFGSTNVQVVQDSLNTLMGDFTWLQHITISIKSSSDPTDYPSLTLVDEDIGSTTNQSVNLNTMVDGNTVFRYLAQGEVELDFAITGSVPNTDSLGMMMCVSVSDSIKKSL